MRTRRQKPQPPQLQSQRLSTFSFSYLLEWLSKNAPFKPEQFAERPCLERTAARSVRRFGVTNFRDVTQSSMIQMFVQRRKKMRAGLFRAAALPPCTRTQAST